MMEFIEIKNAIINLLETNSGVNYQVAKAQKQEKSAEEFIDGNRLVEVYYKRGTFPKDSGRYTGPVQHSATFFVELTVSAPVEVDLAVLENPAATPAQIQTALNGMKLASVNADEKMDELISIVWNILFDAENHHLGLAEGKIASRWIDDVEKGDPNPRGSLVMLTATMPYSCVLSETPGGEDPIDNEEINLENEINEDTNQKTGIIVN